MLNFFKNSHDMDIEKVNKLFKHYKTINCDIRTYFESKPTTKFMELVIDSQSASDELSKFLGLSSTKELKKKNSSKA
ncbi:hypothetical protein W04_1102 [Pseudoalteromonas sp. SW0106-04]|nr:hypothetical protein W04_1102 [Pseudoalteromonas sp. SW0106-04]